MKWKGPYRIDKLLDQFQSMHACIPESNGVYVVSVEQWHGKPTKACKPLYVGSTTTDKSRRFRTRIGDLIADMFGFYVKCENKKERTGHHSGGQTLHSYCKKKRKNPKELYIGWAEVKCVRCAENDIYKKLDLANGLLRKCGYKLNKPSRCDDPNHSSVQIKSGRTQIK